MNVSATRAQFDKVMATHSRYPLLWGPTRVDGYIGDPKRLGFFMARYKFAGKMLRRCKTILDVGCGDGMGTLAFLSDTECKQVIGVDFEAEVIEYAREELLTAVKALRPADASRIWFSHTDFLQASQSFSCYEGLACMDVIEHIEPALGGEFIERLADTLLPYGVAVIGTPSLASEQFASVHSKAGHINLYDPDRLRSEMEKQFKQVFMFSMNDEIVHTGFDKLAHYLIAVAVK